MSTLRCTVLVPLMHVSDDEKTCLYSVMTQVCVREYKLSTVIFTSNATNVSPYSGRKTTCYIDSLEQPEVEFVWRYTQTCVVPL